MSLHPPNYDPRRLFPFGLSPIPEVPSELASEVSSIASSPTPSYEDSDTEVESVRSRSIMYSGSCDSIKSNVTIHGKSSSESETDSEDEATEEEDTEDEHSVVIQNIPFDTKPPNFEQKTEAADNTLYNSEVTQVMHQRTFINSTESEQDDREKDQTNEGGNHPGSERPDVVFDMGSGAATASEIFRHLQATRGKQEVTTELAKILTVLKTTLQSDKDSSSSDEETNTNIVPVKNPMPTGKPPRPPFRPKAKSMASLSPIIQAKIKELEQSKNSNPKDEMNLLSKILVHLLCSCKSAAASQELKAVIKQFKEVAKVAMEEGDDTLESIKSNSRPTSRSSRRKIRSRTASGNSNISGNSETDSMNTLTPGDSKSSEDDETGQDSNINKLRFTSNVCKKDDVESCVSYTLTLPLAKQQDDDDGEQYDEGDEEWEWEYEEDYDTSTPTKQGSSGSSRNLTPSEGKSDVSSGSTRKILTEMEMGAYNSSTSHSDHGNSQSTPITEEDEYSDHDQEEVRDTELAEDGKFFCHLEETFKVLSDTYKIITTENNSPECENLEEKRHTSDDGFEGILDVISNQCVQIETEIKRTSRQSTPASPGPGKSSLPNSRSGSRASSRPTSKMSRTGSRASKAVNDPNDKEEEWADEEEEWEYYYPEGDEKNQSRPQSRQKKGSSRPPSRTASRQGQSQAVDAKPKAPSRPASKNENAVKSNADTDDWNYDEWGDPEEWEYYYEDEADQSGVTVCSRPVSRAASRIQPRAPSRQDSLMVTPEKSRAQSRQDTFRAPSVQEGPRAPSRTEIVPSMMEPIRVASRQDVPKAAEIVAEIKDMGERVPSRLRVVSRPASRAKSRATEAGGEEEEDGWEWDDGSGDWEGYEGQWEYYYEADHEEVEAKQETKQTEAKPPAIVVNKDSRPNSRQSNASRPSSRNSSRPVSRTGSRAASRILGIRSALGSVYEEEDGWYEDDDEIARLSPTLSIAPTTRATSPFPEENSGVQHNPGSGFSDRRCSVIQESEESTPRPSTVLCRTPTNRDSVTPRMSRPMSKQSNPDTVGYLTRAAGVSVALAAEYLGQDAIKLAANLPQEFIEENILKESKKKKHRRKGSDSQEEHDDDQKATKKKKKKNKDGKFLPKVGVRELANRLEGELFQDNAVGARMVISKDEVRDVIRETKKKSKNVNSSLQVQDTSKPGTPNRHSPPDKEEKRKSVKEMVQILAGQHSPQVQEQMCGQYPQQAFSGISNCPTSNLPPPPVPPPPQGYYSSPSPSQYPPNYQPYPIEVRPQYPHYPQQDYQGYHPQHPYQQYQQQQQYHAYPGYPPPPHPHYQGYPPQQYQQYPPHQYPPPPPPQGYPNQQYPSYPGQQQPLIYQTENPNQVKVVSGQGQATIVNMRSKSTGARQKEARDQGNRSPDSEAYGTGSTGSDENQAANIDHESEAAEQEGGKKPHKRHSRLFKLLQDSDYTDSDTDREYSSRISMKNVEDNHSKESDMDSVCSGLEKKAIGIDRKHSFRSHKSSNKESDNESVTSSGVERKLSPNSMQKAVTTRRFMQLSLNQDYEPSSSELSTPNSPTAGGPERKRSASKPPARVWNYHADDFDSHAGTSDDSSYQSLQSLNSFDSIYDNNAGREVEEIMKRKVQRDGLYRYSTDSPHNYVTASPKTVDLLRNSPKVVANSPKFDNYQRASPKIEQELMDLQNFPSSPGLTLRQLHSHRNFYGAGAGGYGNK